MFSFVTVSFGICWLPYHVYFIYSYHNPWVITSADHEKENLNKKPLQAMKTNVKIKITLQIMKSPYIKNIYLGFFWLAMVSKIFICFNKSIETQFA